MHGHWYTFDELMRTPDMTTATRHRIDTVQDRGRWFAQIVPCDGGGASVHPPLHSTGWHATEGEAQLAAERWLRSASPKAPDPALEAKRLGALTLTLAPLRLILAGLAMQGLLAGDAEIDLTYDEAAKYALRHADALLAAAAGVTPAPPAPDPDAPLGVPAAGGEAYEQLDVPPPGGG